MSIRSGEKMKRLVRMSVSLLLLFICGVGTAQDKVQEFKLQISLTKDTYLEAEPIWLDVTLINVSQDTARAWGLCLPCQMGFEVIVLDERGDTLEYNGLLYDMKRGPGWIMKPGETYYNCLDLSEHYGDAPEPLAPMATFTFTKSLKPGKYFVAAKHHIRSQTISSNELEFEINTPMGKDQEGYRLLHSAYLAWIKGKSHSTIQDTLSEIIKLYPTSPYAEKAFRHLPQRKDELFLERFPNSGYTRGAIQAITSYMSHQMGRNFLKQIIKQNPETRSAKFAEQMLRYSY
jgi:hypothetical protein